MSAPTVSSPSAIASVLVVGAPVKVSVHSPAAPARACVSAEMWSR